jgi:hypothetical protein
VKEKVTFKNRNNLLFSTISRPNVPFGTGGFTFHLYEVEKTQMGNFFIGRDSIDKVEISFELKNPAFAGQQKPTGRLLPPLFGISFAQHIYAREYIGVCIGCQIPST